MTDYWGKVSRVGPHECWLWMAATDQHGYGRVWWEGRVQRAHRVAWKLTRSNPGDLFVLHHCDNPICVNPNHLFLGTQADNMRDKAKKGRAVGGPGAKFGTEHHMAKLTPAKIAEARVRIQAGMTQTAAARSLGVSQSALSMAVRGLTWKVA